ncbi:hypothetical protein FRB94_014151 [Tulasnella sp. JGI-2019a]|nr:hypothetical protein FRB94_014151 [Tulasnella sp. JGI-2019a]KAG9033091.1 hypothetical protein FRB95_000595 [Tulasnella sp. JGI-2019a]
MSQLDPPTARDLTDYLSFDGADNEDVTHFVRQVKRIALAQGRQRDQAWMFDYAESCFGGIAIRWFDQRQTEGEPLASWDALRHALLNRFESPSSKCVPQPVPAARAPQFAEGPLRSDSGSDILFVEHEPSTKPVQKGRIRVIRYVDGLMLGYFRVDLVAKYARVLCDVVEASRASIFECTTPEVDAKSTYLKLIDTSAIFRVPAFLGLVTSTKERFEICFCMDDAIDHQIKSLSSRHTIQGEYTAFKDVWTYSPGDEFQLLWKGDPPSYSLLICNLYNWMTTLPDPSPDNPRNTLL